MKKIFYITTLALFASAIFIASCKKGYLDVPPQGKTTEEQALIDPDAADKLVVGAYNNLYLPGTVGLKLVVLADVTSDDSDKGSVISDPGFDGIFLDNFTYTPTTGIFNDIWVDNYKGIASANKALSVLEKSTIDVGIRDRLSGEARFIRALLYFNMVRTFGGVVKLTTVPTFAEANNDEFQTRASKEEIYKVITDDLLFGVEHLPIKGEGGAIVGRATKGAAQALLSKVYMYQGNWQGAYDMSQAVITSQKYGLAPVYADIFREKGVNNIESIFEIQTGPYANQTAGGLACDAVSKNYSNFQGPRGTFPVQSIGGQTYNGGDLGFGLNTPSADLAAAYEENDVRRAGTIIFTSDVTTTTLWDGFVLPTRPNVVNERYNYKAYHSPFLETKSCLGINDKDNKPKNIRIIRFAEVLLINAEAATHVGQDALTPLRKVRARANLTTTSATVSDIWKERRVELAMEADRFFDLVRTGRAASVMNAVGKPFIAGKHEVFPIPQKQRDLSGGRLTQNNY
ncbi:RagB/SusD family nutrient uptake outer membrane protein [Pedobacter nyackensis]|uniref:RagB/SusD family nutrient uptake outer membrane protein n=1 Tax=Pedobacter nyackensis TaxID=475255 RepID=UPI00292CC0D5|nr:RagB/SusD family nutrient uptake outer membrane protein [Pedobacter nyackensis]